MLMRHGLIKIGVSQRQEYCILSFKITLKLVTNLTLIKLQTCNLQLTIDLFQLRYLTCRHYAGELRSLCKHIHIAMNRML